MSTGVLDEVYDRLHRLGPEFGGDEEGNNGLTNHAPMTVEVLARRGTRTASSRGWTGTCPG